MDQELQEMYEELSSELKYLFVQILDNQSEDTDYIRYKGSNAYHNRQDKGRIIIGREEGETLSYVYRLRFNSKANEPNKITWYNSDFGFKDLSVILGERNYIEDDVLKLYKRRTDYIDESEVDYITQLFEEIESRKRTVQRDYNIHKVQEAIQNSRKEILQNIISPDRSSAVELWKLLFSQDRDGEIKDNTIEFPYVGENLLLAKTERGYQSENEMKTYPFALIIQETNSLEKFFIKRIPRDDRLDNTSYSWELEDIQDILGFEDDYTYKNKSTIPNSKEIRISENVVASPADFKTEYRRYRNQLFNEIQLAVHNQYYKMFKDSKDIDISNKQSNLRPDGLHIDEQTTTNEVKSIQSELGISESKVREQQEKRDIGRLSANLRREILEDLYLDEFTKWMSSKTYSEIRNYQVEYEDNRSQEFGRFISGRIGGINAEDEIRDLIIDPHDINIRGIYNLANHLANRVFDEERGSNFVAFNNGRIEIDESNSHPYSYQLDGYNHLKINKVIVPTKTTASVYRNDTRTETYDIEKGVYTFRELNSINSVIFS